MGRFPALMGHVPECLNGPFSLFQERGRRGIQSTGVSQSVRATSRDESQSVLSTENLTCFHASFFPFCPSLLATPFPSFSGHLFAFFSPSKSALVCRAKGITHSLERGSFRMDLSRKFGKEIPSRNLREKGSETL